MEDKESWWVGINYIYILDYSDCTICEISVTAEDRQKDIEEVINDYGCDINHCHWMTTKDKIDFIAHLNDDKISSDNEDW